MNTTHWHFDLHPNVTNTDKIVRYVAGALLIGAILVVAPAPVGWVALLPLIAIPVVISAIIGWDPIYALFQKLPIPRLSSFKKIRTIKDQRLLTHKVMEPPVAHKAA